MSDASGYGRQNTHTAKLRMTQTAATPVECPSWCARHVDHDLGRADAFRTHHGAQKTAGGFAVRLDRSDDLDGSSTGTTTVLVDDRELTIRQARALAAALLAAAEAGQ